MCGGTASVTALSGSIWGLSPRVRGNPSHPASGRGPCGSIPACAGEPYPICETASRTRVYPRVCGGTIARFATTTHALGLSPRVRGNHAGMVSRDICIGSIPACAGEPHQGCARNELVWVYPRVCGGTENGPGATCLISGLSPRVRGNRTATFPCASPEGLSPRVRGNRFDDARLKCGHGSIPACAGEPPSRTHRHTTRRVYPRVCGGTPRPNSAQAMRQGLSPRVRGNPLADLTIGHYQGSIPACAGEPVKSLSRLTPYWVYPRVCGGTKKSASDRVPLSGLSPRVRGNRPRP